MAQQNMQVEKLEKEEFKVATIENSSEKASMKFEAIMDDKAEAFTDLLTTAYNNRDSMNPDEYIDAIGKDELSSLDKMSDSLKTPLAKIAGGDSHGDQVGNVLLNLKTEVDKINPNKFDLNVNWFGRLVEKVTGSSKVSKYFAKFQNANQIIEDIMQSLEEGKFALKNSNKIYTSDKQRYYKTAKALEKKIEKLLAVDAGIEERIKDKDDEESRYIQEEVLFPLRQKIQDLQQVLIVTQQGVTSINILLKNNKTLIKSVDRAQNVTKHALVIGVSIAIGLQQQKKTLEAVQSANTASEDLLVANSEALKTQGVEIQKQSANAVLSIDKMQLAFENTIQAIEDVEEFKRASLEPMKGAIAELKTLSDNVSNKIEKIESNKGKDMLTEALIDANKDN